jgi:predicted RNA methylase
LHATEKSSGTISIRKRELAIRLQATLPHPNPRASLEQYAIPPDLAAQILFTACYTHDDIEGRRVADLGTGTGRLALGALMLGADYVVGVDIDTTSLRVAVENSQRLGLKPDWVLGDIATLRGPFDTIIMNPPFGTRKPHADLYFVENAIDMGHVVYSIHKSSTRRFITRWLNNHRTKFQVIESAKMEIPHQFNFHRKRRQYVDVDVYRIECK